MNASLQKWVFCLLIAHEWNMILYNMFVIQNVISMLHHLGSWNNTDNWPELNSCRSAEGRVVVIVCVSKCTHSNRPTNCTAKPNVDTGSWYLNSNWQGESQSLIVQKNCKISLILLLAITPIILQFHGLHRFSKWDNTFMLPNNSCNKEISVYFYTSVNMVAIIQVGIPCNSLY